MFPNAPFPETGTYAVEVSGWDCYQVFFVERTDLEWNESSGKHLVLRRSLLDEAVVFVRLLQPNGSNRSYAVAYQATPMQVPAGIRVYSAQCSPRVPKRRLEWVGLWAGRPETEHGPKLN